MTGMDRVDSMRRKYRRGEPVAAIAREVGVSVFRQPLVSQNSTRSFHTSA